MLAARGESDDWRGVRVFAEMGYVQTGTADIARAAEVSEGSIFYHVGGKRGLSGEIGAMVVEVMGAAIQGDDRLEDTKPGVSVERYFASCVQNDIWQAVTGTLN